MSEKSDLVKLSNNVKRVGYQNSIQVLDIKASIPRERLNTFLRSAKGPRAPRTERPIAIAPPVRGTQAETEQALSAARSVKKEVL